MLNVKVTTCAPHWPWGRQTPDASFVWDGMRFHVDCEIRRCDAWVVFQSLQEPLSAHCPPERTIFIAGEPESASSQDEKFLAQFAHVVSGRGAGLRHPRLISRQPGHPWSVEKSYDELCHLATPAKLADVCLLTSDNVSAPNHREHLEFALNLKTILGPRLDVWGQGLREFVSRWDVLSRYRFAIVLESHTGLDWLTEKLPDALLAWCVPLYHGCPNVADYLPAGSWIDVPVLDADAVAKQFELLLSDPHEYERRLPAVGAGRQHCLDHLQFFANSAAVVRELVATSTEPACEVRLYPAGQVPAQPPPTPSPALEASAGENGVDRKLAGALRVAAWRMRSICSLIDDSFSMKVSERGT